MALAEGQRHPVLEEITSQKAVATRILKVGGSRMLTAKLYDLKSATAERAASVPVGCNAAKLFEGIDQLARQLGAAPR